MADGPKKPRSSDLPPARPVKPAVVPANPATPIPAKPVESATTTAPAAPTHAVPAKPVAASPAPAKPTAAKPVGAKAAPAAPAAKGPPDPLIGRTIARCKIESKIGEGKTSRVYKAMHTALDTAVAVKVLQPEVLKHPELVVKFEQEARALARLDHPNVVKIYDVAAEEGDVHAIVMELLDGEEVLELLDREGRVDPLDAMRIVRQAASGLAAAHAKGLIHRDVKPQNLVLLADGTVKVVDFGLAAQTGGELAAERIGTPHYMSPEVCDARPAEPGSDVYSLGITLYHLLVGAPPYEGKSIKEILRSHIEGATLHPERRLPGLPKGVCDLVRSMTKRDPLTRPEMAQVVATLDQVGGKALATKPKLKRRRAGRGSKGNPALVVMTGIAVVVILVAVLFLSKKGGSQPENPTNVGAAPGATPGNAARPPPTNLPPPPPTPPPTPPTPPPVDPAMASTPPPAMDEPAAATPEPAETEAQRKAR